MNNLNDLQSRLKDAQDRNQDKPSSAQLESNKEMAMGMRAFMEMLGVILGSGLMGWCLDRFFGTSPILLIIFIFLGICAGFFNLYKMSKNLGTAIGSNSLHPNEKDDT